MSEIETALAALRARFLSRAADDLQALRKWSDGGAPDDDAHYRVIHRLAGAAGTFGFDDLSELARKADEAIASGADVRASQVLAVVQELARLTDGRPGRAVDEGVIQAPMIAKTALPSPENGY